MKKILSYEEAVALFNYDSDTGVLTWKYTRGSSTKGTPAGHVNKAGYLYINTHGKIYPAHRLIWLLVHKEYITSDIDHINRVKTDNRISNLRVVSRQENSRNKGLTKSNSSGIKGVSWDSKARKWLAQIMINGRNTYLGKFDTKEEAGEAYCKARIKVVEYTPEKREPEPLSMFLLTSKLRYIPEEGIFVWNKVKNRPSWKEQEAGHRRPDGYISIRVGYKSYLAHTLAWFLTTGELPKGQIDHINRNRSDNRISNLRVVTPKENSRNRSTSKQI